MSSADAETKARTLAVSFGRELLDVLDMAEEGSAELDRGISGWLAGLPRPSEHRPREPERGSRQGTRPFTTSLDEAMKLVPDCVHSVELSTMKDGKLGAYAELYAPSRPFASNLKIVGKGSVGPRQPVTALSDSVDRLPLALCKAAISALIWEALRKQPVFV